MKKDIIKITDTTLRDSQQSIWGEHFELDEITYFLAEVDECGFEALEVWGGGTFESSLKFWNENPWDKLKLIKKNVKKTPLQMVIRGKNLVGYKPCSDEIIEKFLKSSFDIGVSIMRVFDPLNDIDNIKHIIKLAKNNKICVHGVMCYTIAPNYDIDFYVKYAKILKEEGVDRIIIKDPAGILLPKVVVELIKRIKKEIELPLGLHCHLINDFVILTYYEAIKAGITGIDCSFIPVSFPASQPPIENILKIFENEIEKKQIDFGINKEKIASVSKKLIERSYQKDLNKNFLPINLQNSFEHQLTRGSFTFLYEQLKKRNILNKLPKVLDEIVNVRKDLGFPPLIIPISQLVIAQSVYNVLMEKRYKLIPNEIKDFVKGFYGRPINPISEELLDIINTDYGIVNHNYRTFKFMPKLTNIKKALAEKLIEIEDETDYITYAIFPELAIEYFKYRQNPIKIKNNEPLSRPITTEEEILVLDKLMKARNVVEFELNEANHYISIKKFCDDSPSIRNNHYTYMPNNRNYAFYDNDINNNNSNKENQIIDKSNANDINSEKKESIISPIAGIFYARPKSDSSAFVSVGELVMEGDTICIIEAMKVMNEIKASFKCKILKSLVKDKEAVDANQDLFIVEKL
ncbi:MAG: pyruvate carboxylase subunit B [Elusimicrobiota bacterium]|jgi:oxaloacetate decarboxylase alpha subunit|nr:pyruvate carboxylase subunit B [Elusimicrobiota bacterium]